MSASERTAPHVFHDGHFRRSMTTTAMKGGRTVLAASRVVCVQRVNDVSSLGEAATFSHENHIPHSREMDTNLTTRATFSSSGVGFVARAHRGAVGSGVRRMREAP